MDLENYNPLEEFEHNKLKKRSDSLYLSDNHIVILEQYHIDYNNCTNIKELLFLVEEYLNEEDSSDLSDLEIISQQLADYNYYYNTNK